MENKKTAVQFLLDKIIESNASKFGDVLLHGYLSSADIERAKQMEAYQIASAFAEGIGEGYEDYISTEAGVWRDRRTGKQYFEETYQR